MSLKQLAFSYLKNPHSIIKNIRYRMFNTPSHEKHIFVIGAPRSGTTLIQSILSSNELITSFDEETGFFMYRDLFSKKYEDIDDEVMKNIISNSKDMVSLFDLLSNQKRKQHTKSQYFLEKTPQHVLYLPKLVELFPNSKFINVYRDVRDSSISASKFKGIEQGKDIKKFVLYWRKCINARSSVVSNAIIDVKYEDFVQNPENTLKEIMVFLDIEYDSRQLDPTLFSKNSRAGTEGFKKLSSKIDNKSVGKWKSELSDDDLHLINRYANKQLKRLGYL
ncbi:MAG: sulfotransferase [Aliiglaciecola sp.]|uniref:sulfotransferase family protein n=1 Tax=Aliiglaciecola sp. TaxID=1872441 RepID=UPI00329992F2